MARPAAYLPLQDEPITLQSGGELEHSFEFDLRDGDTGRESVVSFVANPFGDNVVSLEWDLNGINILTEEFTSAPARTMQEIVGKDLLKAGGNELKVRVTDTDGSASIVIDDVVLMFTLKV